MSLISAIYEHLITRKKYNKLKLKYDVKCEELENKVTELITEKRIHIKRQYVWENTLHKQEQEIIELKQEISDLKRKARKKREKKNESEGTGVELSSKAQNDN